MLEFASSIPEAVKRLRYHDPSLKDIYLIGKRYTDEEVAELADCLLTHPNVIQRLILSGNRLTDKTGLKLARYIAGSSTIEWLNLAHNHLGKITYQAMAVALRINVSLQNLSLGFQKINSNRVDSAFVDALIINPNRPTDSHWCLYSFDMMNDFDRLKKEAELLGHPSLQAMLTTQVFNPLI